MENNNMEQMELNISTQKQINTKLYNIYVGLKGIYNIGANSLEYLSALLYVLYNNKELLKIIIEADKNELKDIIDEIHYRLSTRKQINSSKDLFANINFKEIITNDEHEHMLKILSKLSELLLKIDKMYKDDKKVLAEAFEYVIMKNASENTNITKNDEFYTPKGVVKTMVNLLDITGKRTVYNPACNLGEFLVDASKSADIFAFGEETNISNYNICMTNLWLHGIENSKISNEYLKRGETNSLKFDIGMANPPFSINSINDEILNDKLDRYRTMLTKNSSSYTKYLAMILENLNSMGRMSIILPHGFLFKKTNSEFNMRKELVSKNYIDAIIGLPEKLFSGTKIPVVILIIDKNKQYGDILFIDASKEYTKKRKINILSVANQEKIIEAYKNKKEEQGFSRMVSIEEIKNNNYDLSISEYIKTEKKLERLNKDEIIENIANLENEKAKIEKEIFAIITKS